jgi:hypothetical protein
MQPSPGYKTGNQFVSYQQVILVILHIQSPLVYLLPKTFKLFGLPIFMNVPDNISYTVYNCPNTEKYRYFPKLGQLYTE